MRRFKERGGKIVKSGNTVILKKDDYKEKMKSLLDDKDTYILVKRDPSSTYRTKVNKLIDDLLTLKCINHRQASSLKSYNGTAPCLYGLIKLHKPNHPVRPIVSFIGSPVYELSKYIEKFLNFLVRDNDLNVKNSLVFKESLLNQVVDDNITMMSLDVQSLFTNIPLELAFQLVIKQWDKIAPHVGEIPKQLFLSILEVICDSRYFSYDGSIYKQRFGLPMGSPISPVLANIVMLDLIKNSLELLGEKVKFIKLYVDDLFLLIENGTEQQVLNVFNSFHPRLKFTTELEKDGALSFLDLKVIRRDNGSVVTDWFVKPTSAGRILNYRSSHPMNQKINCVQNLIKTVIKISSPCFLVANKKRVKALLGKNGYPHSLVDRFWSKFLSPRPASLGVTDVNLVDQNKRFFKFPYVEGMSQGIKRVFKRNIPEVTLAFYNRRKVKSLFSNLKDKKPKGMESNVVYCVNCNDCEKCYYGETSRFLKDRLYKHMYSIRTNKRNETALAAHAIIERHTFDFTDVTIVARERDEQRRKTLEMLFIKKDNKSINYRSDIANLSNIYSGVLEMNSLIH